MRRIASRRHGLVLLVLTLASLALTWPLVCQFTTHLPGNGIDDPALGWNLWWVKHQLIDQLDFDLFHVGWMFHPIAINLAFYTLTPLNGLLSIPLQTAFGLVVANNLLVLSSFVLGGFGTFLLVGEALTGIEYRVLSNDSVDNDSRNIQPPATTKPAHNPQSATRNPQPTPIALLAATAAAFVFAFASAKLFYVALGQFNIASSQWLPFCVLYVLRIGRSAGLRPALRNSALAALFLIFQAWAELTYASFLLLFIAIYFVWLALARFHSPFTFHLSPFTILPFLLLATLFLLSLAPFLWAMLPDLRAEGDFFTSGGGFADSFSADLAGYLVPTRLHPLLGDWVATLPFPNDVGQQIFLGYTVLGLALFGASKTIRNSQFTIYNSPWFWLATTLFFWWMTLGPRVRWLGQETAIPGPFAVISLLPFFNGNRYPSRYSVMVLLGLAVLVGQGVWWLLRQIESAQNQAQPIRSTSATRNRQYALLALLAALFLGEHLSLPLPLNDFRVPEIYQTLAEQPGDFAVLELPTGWRNGARVLGKSDKLIMMQQWYQTVHGQRRLGGNTSRNPPYKFDYFTNAPLLGDLIALMNADRDYMQPVIEAEYAAIVARNRPIAAQVLADLGIDVVTVQMEKSTPALLRFIDDALPLTLIEGWQGLDWEGQPSTIRLYGVDAPLQPHPREINLAAPDGRLALGEGWSNVETAAQQVRYATRANPLLLLNLPDEGGRLELELFGPARAVEVWLNGRWLGSSSLREEATAQWLALEVAPGLANELIDRLELRFAGGLTPVRTLAESPFLASDPQAWVIGKTGAELPDVISLVVQSAGSDVGDFARIWLDGAQVATSEIGYNLVALDESGALLASAAFNTFAAPAESGRLAAWLAQWPPGTVIAGAVRDEASYRLQAVAVEALQRVGVAGDLRGKFRWSHAFVGVINAPAGSALETSGLLQPATVYIGAPVDGPAVSGGVGRVRFE